MRKEGVAGGRNTGLEMPRGHSNRDIELEVREAHLKFNLKKINIWEFPAFIVITTMKVDEGA